MRSLIFVCLAFVIAGCATQPASPHNYSSALSLWEQHKEKPEFAAYGKAFIDAQNAQQLDDNSGCYRKGVGQAVDLLLVVDAAGRISEAYADSNIPKAVCFRAAYAGAQMPAPPFSPFVMRMKMN